MATLAMHDAATLRQALADGDVVALTRVPGIGKRSAERMVLELRDKIYPTGPSAPAPAGAAVNGHAYAVPWSKRWSLGLRGQAGRGGHRQRARRYP